MSAFNNELSRSPSWFQAIFTRSHFRDILIELAAALPPDRAAGVATAIGNRLTERLGDTEIDEPTDVAIDSDLAPLLAVLHHRRLQQQST